MLDCPECGGEGFIIFDELFTDDCPMCDGSGLLTTAEYEIYEAIQRKLNG